MYHSIASKEIPEVAGSFPITMDTMDRFQSQLALALSLGYEIKPTNFLHKPINSNEKWLFITGDDGTVDWTKNVLPWCEKRGYYTHTAVITGPWQDTPIYPLTHVIQVILSCRSNVELIKLSSIIKGHLSEKHLQFIEKMYFYETTELRKLIKGGCNLIFEHDFSCNIIYPLTSQEENLLKNRFESTNFYSQFKYAEVGVHTKRHIALGHDLEGYLQDEIMLSKQEMVKAGLTPSKLFTLPMQPKYGATIDSLVFPLKRLGFKGILCSESHVYKESEFVIPRVDAKNLESFFQQFRNN